MLDLKTQGRAIRALGAAPFAFVGGMFGMSSQQIGLHSNSVFGAAFRDAGQILGGGLASTASFMAGGVGFGARAVGEGAGLMNTGGYTRWRREEKARIAGQKSRADSLRKSYGPHTQDDLRVMAKYGKVQHDPKASRLRRMGGRMVNPAVGSRKFSQRNGWEHLKKAGSNMIYMGPLSPMSLGINSLIGGVMSADNIFDPYDGFAKHFTQGVTGEIGAFAGAGVGAAIAAALVPGGLVAAGIGLIGGGLIGADMGFQAGELPGKFAKFGATHGRLARTRKSTFQDSEAAMTMRQRAMDSIYKSQFNARSAFGQEALAYHA